MFQVSQQAHQRQGQDRARGGHQRQGRQEQAGSDHGREQGQDEGVRDWRHRREHVEPLGGDGQRADLSRAGDGEGLAQDVGQPGQAALDGGGEQDYGRGAKEGELKADIPGRLRRPGEHGRAHQAKRGPDVRAAAQSGRDQGEASHGGGPDSSRSGAAGERVAGDHGHDRDGGPAAQQRRQRSRSEPREDRDLEAAQNQEVHQAGSHEVLLKPGRHSVSDAEHDAKEHRRMRLRNHLFD